MRKEATMTNAMAPSLAGEVIFKQGDRLLEKVIDATKQTERLQALD